MLTTVLLILALWAVTFPAVLALGRLLGRLSSAAPDLGAASAVPESADAPENVVALVPRPQNRLDAPRRAA